MVALRVLKYIRRHQIRSTCHPSSVYNLVHHHGFVASAGTRHLSGIIEQSPRTTGPGNTKPDLGGLKGDRRYIFALVSVM